jgi:uncharacterized damage-inducible protein DinB
MASLIEEYAAGAAQVAEGIAGLGREQLLAEPIAGTWSIQQIVVHLMDSDLIASDRMKRIIAEENPTIIGYDESAFARKLFYDKLDAHAAADIFRRNREMTAVILRNLPAETFERSGTHNEAGRITLADMLQSYVKHLENHMGHLRKKRELVTAPL